MTNTYVADHKNENGRIGMSVGTVYRVQRDKAWGKNPWLLDVEKRKTASWVLSLENSLPTPPTPHTLDVKTT